MEERGLERYGGGDRIRGGGKRGEEINKIRGVRREGRKREER